MPILARARSAADARAAGVQDLERSHRRRTPLCEQIAQARLRRVVGMTARARELRAGISGGRAASRGPAPRDQSTRSMATCFGSSAPEASCKHRLPRHKSENHSSGVDDHPYASARLHQRPVVSDAASVRADAPQRLDCCEGGARLIARS